MDARDPDFDFRLYLQARKEDEGRNENRVKDGKAVQAHTVKKLREALPLVRVINGKKR